MGYPIRMHAVTRSSPSTVSLSACLLSLGLLLPGLAGCSLFPHERVIYDQDDARVTIERDPTIPAHQAGVRNAHPASLSREQIQSLLRVVQVSGYSGTVVGAFLSPQPVPLLTEDELQKYSGPLADAFKVAGPEERVVFSFPKPGGRYSEDRTVGALFLRDRYLHIVLKDHSSILHADTGGGEVRDIRDTKAMKLWVARPAQPATVPDAEEPHWAPFETVHISLNVGQVLALSKIPAPEGVSRQPARPVPAPAESSVSKQDLQNQIKELTNLNLELRQRLDEEARRMKELLEEMIRLRQELEQARQSKPSPPKPPSP
ncbi:MAG TPA: hypothetical protein VFS39_15700 [Nitrospira sp.]|nr:hypothetical protein [Nitrospira sp.]